MSDAPQEPQPRRVADLTEDEVEEVAAYVVRVCNGGMPFEVAVLMAREHYRLVS